MNTLAWGHPDQPLHLAWGEAAPVSLSLVPLPAGDLSLHPRLAEILALGHGRGLTSTRLSRSAIGDRLRYQGSRQLAAGAWQVLEIDQHDPVTGLQVTTRLEQAGGPAYRATTSLVNHGPEPVVLQAVTSLVLGGFEGLIGPPAATAIWAARNEWCAESRWYSTPLEGRGGLADINPELHGQAGRGSWSVAGHSTWSCTGHLPLGGLAGPGGAIVWQIEVNGPWLWEIDSQAGSGGAYSLALSGPTDLDHAWAVKLAPGQGFTTVPVSVAFAQTEPAGHGGLADGIGGPGHPPGNQALDAAFGHLTRHRRQSHVPWPADSARPLVFNDYMNALMGDPTTEKLLPLIDAAAAVGAQVFCIDAGWYDDGGDWWPSVGAWEPSTVRFGDLGLTGVLAYIERRGLKPGLWVEPEVIGVQSPVAASLPEEAFMHRLGQRIVEHDRYFLDLRAPAARSYLDQVFARLIGEYGATYFKWDYNVTPGLGPDDAGALTPGAGLLDHARAHLEWFDRLRARYPEVIFEACSSGAQRMDQAILSRYDLQSTSDQMDYRLYPVIAAAAPAAMAPEQAGNWAYPQPSWSLEQTAFTLVTGLAGRLYLSGHLNQLNSDQLALVRQAADLYPEVIGHHAGAVPRWPLGLPGWEDPVVALATVVDGEALVFVWHRPGPPGGDVPVAVSFPELAGRPVSVDVVFPRTLPPWPANWDHTLGALRLDLRGAGEAARVFRLRWSA
ncbi:MAG: alpha-galactosidase [Bifidobacteriaceae bacterium]|jgi:alpha-galactosidase|nr:alpha-galactosidase [Bifidobacteriaceae bacterium]